MLSLTSIYSNAGEANAGKFEIRGRVLISLEYDCRAAVLDAHIRQCEGLAAVDSKRNRSNPCEIVFHLIPPYFGFDIVLDMSRLIFCPIGRQVVNERRKSKSIH